MEADVLNALKTQAAYLSGARERPLIIVNISNSELKKSWKKQPLDICLNYLLQSLSKETLRNGLDVVIDAQNCSWRNARNAIQIVSDAVHGRDVKLYAVRAEVFWDKQRVDNCAKVQKFMDATIITKSRLHKYFDSSELPDEFGGTLAHNHEQWLKNRIRIEDFQKSFNKVIIDVDSFKESLVENKSEHATNFGEFFKSRLGTFMEMQNVIKLTVKNGNKLVLELNDSLSKNYCLSRDIIDAKEIIIKSLNNLNDRQVKLNEIWNGLEKHLDELKKFKSLHYNINRITKWIQSKGEEMINEQFELGSDLESAQLLRDAHDHLEMKCCEIYGLYAEIKYNIKEFSAEWDSSIVNSSQYRDLVAQKQFMDFLCRSFANRLERRRLLLITSVRFFRFVTTYFSETSQVFDRLIVGNKIEDFETCIHNLSTLRNKKILLARIITALESEGEKLSDLLSMPTKDIFGRDNGIDYSEKVANVHDILNEAINRRRIFSESVDLQIITLEQIAHIHTYERDAAISITWLNDLLDVTVKMHSHVGCDVFEIQRQKQNLQTIQETAQKIYNYGVQLLDASLALRSSCKLKATDNREKHKILTQTWNQLDTFGQEQMTRLRVSAIFHRTMEEKCLKLIELRSNVESQCGIDDKEEKMARLRSYLFNREQLLVEIGRMIRLGRLLKSRLKEQMIVDKNNNHKSDVSSEEDQLLIAIEGNQIASNAITARLNEVSKAAESLDISLREMQNCLEMNRCRSNSLDRKNAEGNTSISSTDELNSIAKLSTEDESFHTASECTFTPQSHSSAYETASEGGLMSPWWTSSGTEKNSFETCSSSDMDSEIPSMQLLSGVISSATTSYDESEHSFLSTIQSPLTGSEDECIEDIEKTIEASNEKVDTVENSPQIQLRINEENSIFIGDRSSWSLVTKQTVKGCL